MDSLQQKLSKMTLNSKDTPLKELTNKVDSFKPSPFTSKKKTLLLKDEENGVAPKEELRATVFRQLLSSTVTDQVYKKFIVMAHRGATYSLKFLKGPSEKFLESKKMVLEEPKNSKKKFLMLDLDETLIHTVSSNKEPYDVALKLDNSETIYFNVRPYCYQFLKRMSDFYTIYVFTASTTGYAKPIIEYLNRNHKTIHDFLSRANCMETKNGFFIKDLRIISNRTLKDIVLVDNLVHSFGLQMDNGIPILEFRNDEKDCELKHIGEILMEAKQEEDVRRFLVKRIGMRDLVEVDEKHFESL